MLSNSKTISPLDNVFLRLLKLDISHAPCWPCPVLGTELEGLVTCPIYVEPSPLWEGACPNCVTCLLQKHPRGAGMAATAW